jgi:hypothetical protein
MPELKIGELVEVYTPHVRYWDVGRQAWWTAEYSRTCGNVVGFDRDGVDVSVPGGFVIRAHYSDIHMEHVATIETVLNGETVRL